jgi:hypothetical protein
VKISDVLWKAANVHLACEGPYEDDRTPYICHAIRRAQQLWSLMTSEQREDPAIAFLLDLGMEGGGDGFCEFHRGRERQGVRYAWLMLAHEIALERGL